MNYLVFLGTGGGGKVVFRQVRASGGIYIEINGKRFIVDPGPGSLVNMRKLKLKDPHGILLSHAHPDHFTDANILLDGIENPFLIAERHCIEGRENEWPCITRYHQSKCSFLKAMEAGDTTEIPSSEIMVRATKTEHPIPAIGFVITGSRKIGYLSDTVYFRGMEKPFDDCDLIILNVLVPSGKVPLENKHLGIDDAINFVNALKNKPKLAIIQHFSFWMLKNNVEKQAKLAEKKTSVRTIAAKDFMKINLEKLEAENHGLEKFA